MMLNKITKFGKKNCIYILVCEVQKQCRLEMSVGH